MNRIIKIVLTVISAVLTGIHSLLTVLAYATYRAPEVQVSITPTLTLLLFTVSWGVATTGLIKNTEYKWHWISALILVEAFVTIISF